LCVFFVTFSLRSPFCHILPQVFTHNQTQIMSETTPNTPAPTATPPKKDDAWATFLGWVVLLILIVVVISTCNGGKDTTPDTPTAEDMQIKAQVAAETLVGRQLKAPGSAEYTTTIRLNEDDWYLLYVECDSQNSFGATLRSRWFVVVKIIENGSRYYHNTQYAAQQCQACDETEAATMMTLNNWPTTPAK
jgi:hypothetical protein